MRLTRRTVLQFLASSPLLKAARKEFWDTKDPADWTAQEKEGLLTQSPWAREGSVRMEIPKSRPSAPVAGDMPDARPGNAPGTVRSVPIGEKPPPPPNPDTGKPVQFRVLARWESAKPVRLAGGTDLPEETKPSYAIKLQGMPLMPKAEDNESTLATIKQNARLERKDKPAIRCSHLLTGSGDKAGELLLFFEPGQNPITAADKQVSLETQFGLFVLSVKFSPKEMLYRGELAL